MPVHRRRYRIEEAFAGDMPMLPEIEGGEVGPMHREIMSELRAIRAQMGTAGQSMIAGTIGEAASRENRGATGDLATTRSSFRRVRRARRPS